MDSRAAPRRPGRARSPALGGGEQLVVAGDGSVGVHDALVHG
jgi:hypothetical protein